MQDEMMDLMDVSNEIQETLGRSYSVPDDIDEEDLMGGKLLYYLKAQMSREIFFRIVWRPYLYKKRIVYRHYRMYVIFICQLTLLDAGSILS